MVREFLLHHPLGRFLAQLVVIVVVSRLLGLVLRRISQPMVVAEVTAGILLGPSFLGWIAPDVSSALFAPDSLGILQMLSQVGLVLFMFLVGLELDPRLLQGRGRSSVAISHTSIIVPFVLGVLLAFYVHDSYGNPDKVGFTEFALFMGVAMSITAFPVLARILTERRLLNSRVGAVTIACAAVDDVTAWCILAFVVAITQSTGIGGAVITTLLALGYVAAMILLLRPVLVRMGARVASPDGITQNAVAAVLVMAFVSSWITELIGIHALFGAFMFGAIAPKEGGLARALAQKLEDVVLIVLLPLFFVFSGLRTRIGLVDSPEAWMVCALVIVVACAGKFGGSAIAARLTGLRWRESVALGILMNTRGLMELIVLNIGLDLGVITPTVFSMMVLMALFTTFITTPMLRWIYPPEQMALDQAEPAQGPPTAAPVAAVTGFSVLACVSHEQAGPGLVTMASALLRGVDAGRVDAVHLIRSPERASARIGEPETEPGDGALAPALERAAELELSVDSLSFVSTEPARDICDLARSRGSDIVLLGWHKPVLTQSRLGGVVHEVLAECGATVGVFVDRGLAEVGRILVPFQGSAHDRAALSLAHRIMVGSKAAVTVLHVVAPSRGGKQRERARSLVEEVFSEAGSTASIKVVESRSPSEAALAESRDGYDLVIVGVGRQWGLRRARLALGLQSEKLMEHCPTSLLVVRDRRFAPSEAQLRAGGLRGRHAPDLKV